MGKSDALSIRSGSRWARVWKLLSAHKGAHRVGMYVAGHQEGKENRATAPVPEWNPSTGPSADRYSLLFSSAPPSTPAEDSGQTTRYCQRWWDCILQSDSIRAGRKRIHHYLAVHHRPGTDILVDAPGARDHADIFLVHHVYRQGAGIDIKTRRPPPWFRPAGRFFPSASG